MFCHFVTGKPFIYVLLQSCILALSYSQSSAEQTIYTIGGWIPGSNASFLKAWRPVFEDYLSSQVGNRSSPRVSFRLVPTDYDLSSQSAVMARAGKLDFISTERLIVAGKDTGAVGSLIYSLKSNANIRTLFDLKGKRIGVGRVLVAAVFPLQFKIVFYQSDFHRQLRDVQSGVIDAAFVLGGWLEANHPEAMGNLLFHNLSTRYYQGEQYPFLTTTDLMPQFGISAGPNVPWELREQIADSLRALNRTHPAAIGASITTFTRPGTLSPVKELLQDLGIMYRDDFGSFQCYDSFSALTNMFKCPAGYQQDLDGGSCAMKGMSCPAGLSCICRPCVVPLGLHMHHIGPGVDPSEDNRCEKMHVCAEAEQNSEITFLFENLVNQTVRIQEFSGNMNSMGGQCVITNTSSPCQISISAATLGSFIMEVFIGNEQAEFSPILIKIVPKVCSTEPAGWGSAVRVPDQAGACGCPSGSFDLVQGSSSCTLISLFIPAIILPTFVIIAGIWYACQFKLAHRKQAALKAFISDSNTADVGQPLRHLPYPLCKEYVPDRILGKGAFGCVVLARRNDSDAAQHHVAIKLVLPTRGRFQPREVRQLKREAAVLTSLTAEHCLHAVLLAGIGAVNILPEVGWFIMEYLQGEDLAQALSRAGPLGEVECVKVARSVLAALKVLHAEGVVHRDIKPANIMAVYPASGPGPAPSDKAPAAKAPAAKAALVYGDASPAPSAASGGGGGGEWKSGTSGSVLYKLVDFGAALGVDEVIARESMMTVASNRPVGAGTPPYMSPEMFLSPETAVYPTDLWSLGVTLFELATGTLPFHSESDMLWSMAVAGNLDEKAPSLLDRLEEGRRAGFDHNVARVVEKALEKRVEERFQSVDEMHEAVYRCLVCRGEAVYSVFISYRVASERPLARLLFDELNHTVTPGGHRVTVYWDAHRLVKGEDWEAGFTQGLLNSLCVFPVLSYGSTAPLAALPPAVAEQRVAEGWEARPCGYKRLTGGEADAEDNVLKEFMIAGALLDRRDAPDRGPTERGILQSVYPIFVGRPHPEGAPGYPGMGSFFQVQGGGGEYPDGPSPRTADSVAAFLREGAGVPAAEAERRCGVKAAVQRIAALQGCLLWAHPPELVPVELCKEQLELVGQGYAGPEVDLGGVVLSESQRKRCRDGLDRQQLEMLKAQIRARRGDFHEVIDRAVEAYRNSAHGGSGLELPAGFRPARRSTSARRIDLITRFARPAAGVEPCCDSDAAG